MTQEPITVTYTLEDILKQITEKLDTGLDKIEQKMDKQYTELNQKIDNLGLIVTILGGAAKMLGWIGKETLIIRSIKAFFPFLVNFIGLLNFLF